MASIEKRGSSYKITVSTGYDSVGKKLRKTLTWEPPAGLTPKQTEKALQAAAAEFEARVKSGQVMDGSIKLADFEARWWKEYAQVQLEATTLRSYRCELDAKLLPALGHIRLDKLQPVHILSFLNNLLEDGCRLDGSPGCYSNRTVKYQHAILSSILQTAVYWQVIGSNPCDRVKVPRKTATASNERGIQFFTDDQVIRFLEAAKASDIKYQAIAYIAIFGGLRRGEILGLTWDDVDLDTGFLSISRSNTYLPGKGIITKATKTSGSTRGISLPGVVLDILRHYKEEQARTIDKLGEMWRGSNLLFTQWDGRPMHPSTPRQWFVDTIDAYNKSIDADADVLPERKAELRLPRIPFHGLRHTSATLMIASKADVKTVSARLGHAQTSTTMNIYSHALRSSDKMAADALEAMLTKREQPAKKRRRRGVQPTA